MARKIKRPFIEALQDIKDAQDEGWTVQQFSLIHYRITMKGMRTVVDVWPTAKKLWRHSSGLKSRSYTNLNKALATEFSHEE